MSDIDPRFNPAYQPGFDPSKHSPEPTATVPVVDDEPAPIEQPAASVAVAPARATLSRRRNPVLVALWVLSALFVASGVYGLQLIGDRVAALGKSGGFGGADYYLLQSYTILAPLLIGLGLATALGTLFVLAVRWKAPQDAAL
jgi:hypothetical protein